MVQLFIGLIAEGKTDYRFFKPIIEKTLTDIAFDCKGQIDIDVKVIKCDKGETFNDYVLNGSKMGHEEYGISILIVHTDADDLSDVNAYNNKIKPALSYLMQQPDETFCKNIVALVPVFETESWMLADKQVLIDQIGTKKSETDLEIDGHPEGFRNPKQKIENAIRIGREDFPRKLRNSLQISELYSFLGQAIQIKKLKSFKSFIEFQNNIKKTLLDLNLLTHQD